MKSALLPCNHLFFFVGGVSTTAQDFGRCGEEVEAVVFKILVYQRQKNLREKTFPGIIISAHHIKDLNRFGTNVGFTLAKNLISCSCGDFSTRPLLTTASVKTHQQNFSRFYRGSNTLLLTECMDEEQFYQDVL